MDWLDEQPIIHSRMRVFLTGSGSSASGSTLWTSSTRMKHETCVTQCDSININRMSIQKHLCHDTKHILHVELLWVCVYGFLSHRHLSENRLLDIPSWARSHGSPASDQPPKVSVCCTRKMPGSELACFGGIYVHICFTGNCIDIDWMTSAQLPANSWFVKISKEVWKCLKNDWLLEWFCEKHQGVKSFFPTGVQPSVWGSKGLVRMLTEFNQTIFWWLGSHHSKEHFPEDASEHDWLMPGRCCPPLLRMRKSSECFSVGRWRSFSFTEGLAAIVSIWMGGVSIQSY